MIQPVIPVPIFVRSGGGDLTNMQLAIVLGVCGVSLAFIIGMIVYAWRTR